jgi:endonuclease YncB( thermonuclease family)
MPQSAVICWCNPLNTSRFAKWADGDSFEVQTADGSSHTLRLYGADCIEWHVTDETDARVVSDIR